MAFKKFIADSLKRNMMFLVLACFKKKVKPVILTSQMHQDKSPLIT